MLHSDQRLLFPAKRLEGLSLEVEKVLFGRSRCPRRIAAADDVCQFARDMGLIIGDVTGPSHQMNSKFDLRSQGFAENRQLFRRRWAIAGCRELQYDSLGV